jgi:hypothetical protein
MNFRLFKACNENKTTLRPGGNSYGRVRQPLPSGCRGRQFPDPDLVENRSGFFFHPEAETKGSLVLRGFGTPKTARKRDFKKAAWGALLLTFYRLKSGRGEGGICREPEGFGG